MRLPFTVPHPASHFLSTTSKMSSPRIVRWGIMGTSNFKLQSLSMASGKQQLTFYILSHWWHSTDLHKGYAHITSDAKCPRYRALRGRRCLLFILVVCREIHL